MCVCVGRVGVWIPDLRPLAHSPSYRRPSTHKSFPCPWMNPLAKEPVKVHWPLPDGREGGREGKGGVAGRGRG